MNTGIHLSASCLRTQLTAAPVMEVAPQPVSQIKFVFPLSCFCIVSCFSILLQQQEECMLQ